MKSTLFLLFLAFASVAAMPLVAAQDCCRPMEPMAAHGESGVAFVSGGVGEDELNALAAVAAKYSLKLVFAEKEGGAFLSDVQVSIEDAKGRRLIDATSEGPWFLADLKPGRYRLTASALGAEKKQPIAIRPGRQTRLVLHFP